MRKPLVLASVTCLSLFAVAVQAQSLGNLAFSETTPYTSEMTLKDDFTIVGKQDLMKLDALNADGTARAIVEIPTGTSAKWEVSKDDPKAVYWEYKNEDRKSV